MTTATKTNTGWTNRLGGGLVALTLLGVTALLPGCGGSGSCAGEVIRVTWQLQANNQVVQCAIGDQVELRVDTDAMTMQFPCGDGAGVSPAVDPHVSHVVSVSLVDASGQVVSHTDPMTVLAQGCGQVIDAPPVVFPVDAAVCGDGKITVGWSVTGNGSSLSCAQAGATEVDIRVDTDQMTAPFDCNAHVGTTPAIAGGVNHSVSMALLDAAGNVLSSTPDQTVFVPCNVTVDVGNIELSLTQ